MPMAVQRRIALCLNVSWSLHFLTLACHLHWWSCADSQTTAGSVLQNVPFGISILSGCIQAKAEKPLLRKHPEWYPPSLAADVLAGASKWRRGDVNGSLWHVISAQLAGNFDVPIHREGGSCGCVSESFRTRRQRPNPLTGVVHGVGGSAKRVCGKRSPADAARAVDHTNVQRTAFRFPALLRGRASFRPTVHTAAVLSEPTTMHGPM